MVSLKSARDAIAKARDSVDAATRLSIAALILAGLALIISVVLLGKIRTARAGG